MKLQEIDTLQELKIWVGENMQGATVEESEGGITIHTGLISTVGGYLYPMERECAYCESGIAEIHNHEREGECDKCANPYEISSKEGRCGDCGNCGDCCTHKEKEGE
jgi:hypothetical protein